MLSHSPRGDSPDQQDKHEQVLRGTAAALGNAIGKAFVLSTGARPNPPVRIIDSNDALAQEQRFDQALQAAQERLDALWQTATDQTQRAVLQFQSFALKDRSVIQGVRKKILEGERVSELPPIPELPAAQELVRLDAVSAVWKQFGLYKRTLQSVENPYLRARASDIDALRWFLIDTITGVPPAVDYVAQIQERCVLVAYELTPGQAASLRKEHILGVVTSAGSTNDHVAVIAKALGIPLIIGVDIAQIPPGDTIVVDGDKGTVLVNPSALSIQRAQEEIETLKRTIKRLPISERAPKTRDGESVTLAATMDNLEQAAEIKEVRARGVGLFRTEWLPLRRGEIPSEEEQVEEYKKVLKLLSPDAVVIRMLDLGADKLIEALPPLQGSDATPVEEANPALGLRGIRLALHYKDSILVPQIRAILRAAVYGEARILIPMVNDPGEVQEVRRVIAEESEKLTKAGIDHEPNLKVGAQFETTAAAMLAFRLFGCSDFANIGTNDITQYTLALDRGN
ncbi:MAG: phosphoenolpyruvate--protein phosphotransferase, partial [Proteobacteria bacterium]|nr:phosphoenolpyruvate--protein phosphotransferase [Pseudomonadota bacterium]